MPISDLRTKHFWKAWYSSGGIQHGIVFIDDSTSRTPPTTNIVSFHEATNCLLLAERTDKSMNMESVIFWWQEVELRFVVVFFWTEAFWWNPGRWTCRIEGLPFVPFLITLNNSGRTLTDNCGQFYLLDWSLRITARVFPSHCHIVNWMEINWSKFPKNYFQGFWRYKNFNDSSSRKTF